jgi:hypothetical protein
MPKISELSDQPAPLETQDVFAYVRSSAGTAGSRKVTWGVIRGAAVDAAVAAIQPILDALEDELRGEIADLRQDLLDALFGAGLGAAGQFGLLTDARLRRDPDNDVQVAHTRFAYIEQGRTRLVPEGTVALEAFPSDASLSEGRWAAWGIFVQPVDGVDTVVAILGKTPGESPVWGFDTQAEAEAVIPTAVIVPNAMTLAAVDGVATLSAFAPGFTPEVGDTFVISTTTYTITAALGDEYRIEPPYTGGQSNLEVTKARPIYIGSVVVQAGDPTFTADTDALQDGTTGNPAAVTLYGNDVAIAPSITTPAPAGGALVRVPTFYAEGPDGGGSVRTHTISADVTRVDIELWSGGSIGEYIGDDPTKTTAGVAGDYAAVFNTPVTPGETLDLYVGKTFFASVATGPHEGYPSAVSRGALGLSTTNATSANDALDAVIFTNDDILCAACAGTRFGVAKGDVTRRVTPVGILNGSQNVMTLPAYLPGAFIAYGNGGSDAALDTPTQAGWGGQIIIWEYRPV